MNLQLTYPVSSQFEDESFVADFHAKHAWGIWTGIDLYDCDPHTIRSETALGEFVRLLCDYIGMKRFGETLLVRFGDDPRVSGYSMTQFIETSLVSGHFVEQDNSAYIDIFSCSQYYPFRTACFCQDFFKAGSIKVMASLRGAGRAA